MNPKEDDLYTAPLDGEWIKSSHSTINTDNCVRLMRIQGGVALDDSKRPDLTPLRYSRAEIDAFISAIKTDKLDH